MNKKLGNKGFTLIELLAALVLIVIIMSIAIPSISSSLERTKDSQNEARYKIIESYAEQYVTDHKNAIYKNMEDNNSCYIQINELSLDSDEMEDANGNDLSNYYIVFTKPSEFKFIENGSKGDASISCILN